MEQVDARCPQALKSPAEDEVTKRNVTHFAVAHRIRNGLATPIIAVDCRLSASYTLSRVFCACGLIFGARHAPPSNQILHCLYPRWLAQVVFDLQRSSRLVLIFHSPSRRFVACRSFVAMVARARTTWRGFTKVELNVDMLDPLTFRFVERLVRQALQGAAASASAASSSAASASASSSKSKSGGSGGSSGPKKRKNSDGESRPKKQRT